MRQMQNNITIGFLTFIGLLLITTILFNGCGLIPNMNQTTNTIVDTGSGGTSNPSNCNMTWNYADTGRSGIVVINIIGSNSGSFKGTCSDSSATGGTFIVGDTVDPCVSDAGTNTSTFTLACGYTQDIVFDS